MNDRILYTACPLCASTEIPVHHQGNCAKHPFYHAALSPVMTWKKCARCAHIFTEGYFTPEAAHLVFSKGIPHLTVGFDMENQRLIASRMVEKILPYASEGAWLDVGFGNASLLFTAQEYGFTPVGVDLRQENVTALQNLGIEAHLLDICQDKLPRRFRVVSMADVLEHMPFPGQGLGAVRDLLEDGGLLFLSMPNFETIVWRALDQNKANPYWGELEHYHNFCRRRLYALLAEYGFAPLRYGVSERYRTCMEVIARKN